MMVSPIEPRCVTKEHEKSAMWLSSLMRRSISADPSLGNGLYENFRVGYHKPENDKPVYLSLSPITIGFKNF